MQVPRVVTRQFQAMGNLDSTCKQPHLAEHAVAGVVALALALELQREAALEPVHDAEVGQAFHSTHGALVHLPLGLALFTRVILQSKHTFN